MNEIAKGVYAGANAEMVGNLLRDFRDEALEQIQQLEVDLAPEADIEAYRRFAFMLKGQAHNFGLPLLEVVARRMEDYLSAVAVLGEPEVERLHVFLDTVSDVLEGRVAPDADAKQIVRSLPARPANFDEHSIEVRDVEVMLVMLHGAQTHYVEREMQACGYRVTIVTATVAALEQAVRTRPDIVVISAVMPHLSGIDLAVALSAMPETRNIPCALITSLPPDDEHLAFVPDRVPVIRKGSTFGDDLAAALSYHFLL